MHPRPMIDLLIFAVASLNGNGALFPVSAYGTDLGL